ncbi:MAG TPA: hypothetical protein VIF62_27795 [Labilithrix sp.]
MLVQAFVVGSFCTLCVASAALSIGLVVPAAVVLAIACFDLVRGGVPRLESA